MSRGLRAGNPVQATHSFLEPTPKLRCTVVLLGINEQKISVTRSLATALKYMRRNDEELILWNDATCINQNDEIEKGSQIMLMGQIYARGKSDT